MDGFDTNQTQTGADTGTAHASREPGPELTVVIISYNTRELTIKAIETLFATTLKTSIHVIVLDNDSKDGSVDAIRENFPQVELIASSENLGFAAGNNVAAKRVETEWLLLLNPDTECHEGAVDNLLGFAKSHPEASIFGGRTVFPDGSLNLGSCWRKTSLWSLLCSSLGLTLMFPKSSVFNPEIMGAWQRDDVREVDIVAGCFLLTRRKVWEELKGFDLTFFMYGEETDFCLRAGQRGHKLMITPDAEIMHLVGAATGSMHNVRKTKLIFSSKITLVRKFWPQPKRAVGIALLKLVILSRAILYAAASRVSGRFDQQAEHWTTVWRERDEWLNGFSDRSTT